MELTKFCRGCACSKCRWQGTDNCLHDKHSLCSQCMGRRSNVAVYQPQSFQCTGFMLNSRIKYMDGEV